MEKYDVIVIGGGPAGLSAAIEAHENGAAVLLVERENALGGILKQCIHDGFGLTRYGEKLSGPEYAGRDIKRFEELGIGRRLETFVTDIEKTGGVYVLTVSSRAGIEQLSAKAIILACGCRERTARQVFIHGTRPAGIYTAGNAQNFVNLRGQMPVRKCVILGSGDIGLIMARRLTLEGAEVLGVYEVKRTPSGLKRNIAQCLDDFNIPLHLSTTVTRVFGEKRLTAVEVAAVDDKMDPIPGTEEIIECDGLIISVGLIPENEIAEKLGVEIDRRTRGAFVDNNLHSLKEGIFAAGNCLSVNDLVDYVSENGSIAGKAAAEYARSHVSLPDCEAADTQCNAAGRQLVAIKPDDALLYCIPQYLDLNSDRELTIWTRSRKDHGNMRISVQLFNTSDDGTETFVRELCGKNCRHIRSAEADKLHTDLAGLGLDDAELNGSSCIRVVLQAKDGSGEA